MSTWAGKRLSRFGLFSNPRVRLANLPPIRFSQARVPEVHFELSVFCFEITSLSDFETPDFGIPDLKIFDFLSPRVKAVPKASEWHTESRRMQSLA
jgi:hypothetical protein